MSGISEAGEKPIGEHGTNYFYKEFMVSGSGFKNKKYQLGSFYFVRKSSDFPIAIAEILLIWSSKNSDKKFASTKLYLKPEETNFYGKDELVVAERNVVVECHKFPLWECSPENWYTNTGEFLGTHPGQKPLNECVIKVLSFPQYCRYQAYKKLVESGVKISEKMILALGGIKFDNQHVLVVFSRKSIQKENVVDFSPTQDVLVPQFRGRPRKRKNKCIVQQENFCKRRALISEDRENKNALSLKDDPEVKDVLPVLSPITETNDVVNQTASCTGVSSVSSKQCDTHNIVYPTDPNEFKSFLYEFMRNRGTPITKIPVIGYVKVNLFNLFSLVDIHGGYFEVTLKRQWRRVYELLGHCNTITNSATITRKAYENLLLPFESYLLSKTGLKVPEYLNGGKEVSTDEKGTKDKSCKKSNFELQANTSYVCKPTNSLLFQSYPDNDIADVSHTAQKPNALSVRFNSLTSSKVADPQNDAFKLMVLKSRGRPTKEFRTQIGQLCQSTQVDHDCPPLDNKSRAAISSLKTMEDKKYLGQTKSMLQPNPFHYYPGCKNREFSSLNNTLSKRLEINTLEINEKHSLLEDSYNCARFSSADDLGCEASAIPDCSIGTFKNNSLSNTNNLDLNNAQSSYGAVRPQQVYIHASANISSTCAAQTNETTCDDQSFVCGSSLKSKENNNLDERDIFYKTKSVYPFQQRHKKQPIALTKEHSQYHSVYSSYN